MAEALKKASQEAKNKPQQGMPPPPGQQGPPPDPSLIDKIAELKMIRSMQERVNNRTKTYAKAYDGPQPDPKQAKNDKEREQLEMIQHELKDLGNRQEKISKVTGDIAKGKNKGN